MSEEIRLMKGNEAIAHHHSAIGDSGDLGGRDALGKDRDGRLAGGKRGGRY